MDRERLTIVIAAFNEAESLPVLQPRIAAVLDELAREGVDGQVLYVDDGSRDATWAVMQQLAAADRRVALLRLSRNFGKELALTAGLDRVDDGAALILDADGQDAPELIPQFVAKWREGYDDVHGTRMEREGEGWIKRATAHAFYRVIGALSKTPIPADTGDFRLLSPRALHALQQLRERHRFMKGLFGWVGYNRIAIPYHRDPRTHGRSKFNLWRLWNLALEGITSFSTAAATGDLPGRADCAGCLPLRCVDHPESAAVGRSRRRLADDDVGDPLPRWRAADRAGRDRRIPRTPLRRSQAAAAVPGGQLAAGAARAAGACLGRRRTRAATSRFRRRLTHAAGVPRLRVR